MALEEIKTLVEGFKLVLKGLKVGSVIGLLADFVLDMKIVSTVVSNLMKILTLILSPISFVLIGLLMPLLIMLKPIMLAVTKIFMPFLKLALEFMKTGGEEINAGNITEGFGLILGGVMVLINGITASILALMATTISTFFEIFTGILFSIAGVLFGISQEKINRSMETIKTIINAPFVALIDNIVTQTANMTKTFGIESDGFKTSAQKAISSTMLNGEDNLKDAIKNSVTDYFDATSKSVDSYFTGGFKNSMVNGAKQMGEKGYNYFDKLQKTLLESSQKGGVVTIG